MLRLNSVLFASLATLAFLPLLAADLGGAGGGTADADADANLDDTIQNQDGTGGNDTLTEAEAIAEIEEILEGDLGAEADGDDDAGTDDETDGD